MKAKQELIMREIAGETILIPTGEMSMNLQGMIALTESGALLWRMLQEDHSEEELIEAILAEYDVDRKTAAQDVKIFIGKMDQLGMIEH